MYKEEKITNLLNRVCKNLVIIDSMKILILVNEIK